MVRGWVTTGRVKTGARVGLLEGSVVAGEEEEAAWGGQKEQLDAEDKTVGVH